MAWLSIGWGLSLSEITHQINFIIFAVVAHPLILMGYLAYASSRQTIEQNISSRLVSNTLLKKNDLKRWLDGASAQLRQFALRPQLRELATTLTGPNAANAERRAAHDSILHDHFKPSLEEEIDFLELFLLDPRNGQILVSTEPAYEGMIRQKEAYFIEGQKGAYVDHIHYSLSESQVVMYASTPVKDKAGNVAAVLAGQIDLSIITEIMLQESGLNPTEQTYLVNTFNFFVTNPKFANNVVLKQAGYSPGIQACLAGQTGVGLYNDYRDMPVLGAYRWLPERGLCILTEVDQAEAFAPIGRLRMTIFSVTGLAAAVVVLLGFYFAHSIIIPIRKLIKGTEAVGQGNLAYRIPITGQDEIGQLAAAFNDMIAKRQQTELALQRAHDELELRVQERTEALRQSEERFRLLVNSMDDIIFTLDHAGRHTLVFGRWVQKNGLTPDFFLGKTAREVLGPETAAIHEEANAQALAGEHVIYEWSGAGPAGPLYYQTALSPIRAASGEVTGLVGVGRDITKQKLAEAELRRRNRALALLNAVIAASTISSTPEEILEIACEELGKTFDLPQVTAVLFNQDKTATTVIAQYSTGSRVTALGKSIPLVHHPPLQWLLNQPGPVILDKLQNDPALGSAGESLHQFEIDVKLTLPLRINEQIIGNLLLGAAGSSLFSTEEVDLAWSVAGQIAGSLARARLDQERQLLSTAIEQSAESIIITDPQGIILYVNPAFERVTGYARAEALGQRPNILKSGRQNEGFYQKLWATISAGQVWQGRFVNRKKEGALYTEEAIITPIIDPYGQIVNYVALKRDITQELQREEQYRQAQKMEAIGRLAGGVAHDFNNLLTVITGYTDLLLSHYTGDAALSADLKQIARAGERAARLTRQLLAFSRKQVLQPTILDLNEIITDLDKMLQRLIDENISLVPMLAQNLGRIKADPGQIEQIIMNLVVNARDAMPNGGKLTIETANVYLNEDYANRHVDVKSGWYVMLAVTDTGIGMDAATQSKIFEPFFTTKNDQGTGLGLATVYGIVSQSSGHIWVYSELGQGTTFKIYLPQLEQPAEPVNRPRLYATLQPGTGTILLVEDEEMVRQMVYHTLSECGYTVLQAANGQEALGLCRQYPNPIHLLLTDVIIPGGMSGPEISQHLAPLQPKMKVLYMSGYPNNSIVHQNILKEGLAFLQKPFAPNILAHKVRDVLDAQ